MKNEFPGQILVAYHGCDLSVGIKAVSGEIEHLRPSKNPYDWLGDGIYFFEGDFLRAQHFAESAANSPEKKFTAEKIVDPYTIGAVIQLGHCLDLTKQSGIKILRNAYAELEAGKGPDQELPVNKSAGPSDKDGILHNLDRAVINYIHGQRIKDKLPPYDTIRFVATFTKESLLSRIRQSVNCPILN